MSDATSSSSFCGSCDRCSINRGRNLTCWMTQRSVNPTTPACQYHPAARAAIARKEKAA